MDEKKRQQNREAQRRFRERNPGYFSYENRVANGWTRHKRKSGFRLRAGAEKEHLRSVAPRSGRTQTGPVSWAGGMVFGEVG